MIETIAIGALSLTTIGAGYQWFMARMEREAFRALNKQLHAKLAAHEQTAREQGRQIAELVAENFKHVCAERKRQAQRVAAAAKGRAVQKAKLAAMAAEAKAISDARHAQMRDSLGVI